MPDLKTLRQRAATLRADGDKMIKELEGLLAIESPTDEDRVKIEELEGKLATWEVEAAEANEELRKAEDKARRSQIVNDLSSTTSRVVVGLPLSGDPRQTGGFNNLADFAMNVANALSPGNQHQAQAQARLNEAASLMAAPTDFHLERGSTDGFMVPPVFRDQIYELMMGDQNALLNMVDSEPTAGNQVGMLRDETTPWGSSGVQAYWRAEGSQMTPSRLATEMTDVKLHELYAFVLATEELLQDAPRMNSRLTRQSARAINWKASEAIMHGSGAGQPLGWMNSPALVTVTAESGQDDDTVVAQNLSYMFSRMMADSLNRAYWYINMDVMPQIMHLKDEAGNPVWFGNFQRSPAGVLLGRPIIPLEHCPTLGDKGDIQFVDPTGYYSPRKSSGIQYAESMHLYFDYNIQAFRWTFRLGGQPYMSKPLSPARGSNKRSQFVVLAAR